VCVCVCVCVCTFERDREIERQRETERVCCEDFISIKGFEIVLACMYVQGF